MLIVADDLTGAADAAAAFAAVGHSTRVDLAPAGTDSEPNSRGELTDDIIAIDTHGRAMAEPDAFVATMNTVREHVDRRWFVKIDSTLRGHVRATVDAVLEALPVKPARIVVCPAFPARGRTVIDGCVHVDGEALEAGSVREVFAGFKAASGLFIPTARTDDDIAAVVRAMDDDVLWVGSAGLARHVAERARPATSVVVPRPTVANVAVVVGSQHGRTIEQLAHLDGHTLVERIDPRARNLRERLLPLLAEVDGLVLTGGYTARTVLDLLGLRSLRVGGEVEPGIAWSTATWGGAQLAVVTKSGGFGDELSLRRAVDFLTQSATVAP